MLPVIEKGEAILVQRNIAEAACVLIGMGIIAEEAIQLIKENRSLSDPDAWHIQRRIHKFTDQQPPK
jgi:hypothetical protein